MFTRNVYESLLKRNPNREHSELDIFVLMESSDRTYLLLLSFEKSMNKAHCYKRLCNLQTEEKNQKIATQQPKNCIKNSNFEAYLRPSQTTKVEIFSGNTYWLKSINYLSKNSSSQIFDRVLYILLIQIQNKTSFNICSFLYTLHKDRFFYLNDMLIFKKVE